MKLMGRFSATIQAGASRAPLPFLFLSNARFLCGHTRVRNSIFQVLGGTTSLNPALLEQCTDDLRFGKNQSLHPAAAAEPLHQLPFVMAWNNRQGENPPSSNSQQKCNSEAYVIARTILMRILIFALLLLPPALKRFEEYPVALPSFFLLS
jgi:hypothetical protein